MKAIVSAAALAAALTFSGSAFAQNMIGGQAIPGDRLTDFAQACQALQAASNASIVTGDTDSTTDPVEDDVDETETGSVASEPRDTESDPAAQDNWDQVLATLSADDCAEAGFPIAGQ